jgi:hypothetical protein
MLSTKPRPGLLSILFVVVYILVITPFIVLGAITKVIFHGIFLGYGLTSMAVDNLFGKASSTIQNADKWLKNYLASH